MKTFRTFALLVSTSALLGLGGVCKHREQRARAPVVSGGRVNTIWRCPWKT